MNGILGPRSYENWKAALSDKNVLDGYEVPLFTDAHIIGEILEGFGPYQFLNSLAITRPSGSIAPRVILRVKNYLEISFPPRGTMSCTNDLYYHGGTLYDEIAALASLILGVRFKSGGITREFKFDRDPHGTPILIQMYKDPILLVDGEKLVIPQSRREKNLNDLNKLLTYPNLAPEDAITLVKVARMYQNALWIAESEPELAWIIFVSSIETAADHWCQVEAAPVEKLKTFDLDLVEALDKSGGNELVEYSAKRLVKYMGATQKFLDFVLTFLPPEPMNRPEKSLQHPWDKINIKKTLTKIYNYRSKALHSGKTFPAPMCMPPTISKGIPSEVPLGLATMAQGGRWIRKDTPILLHTFEYIVRGALLSWWNSLYPETKLLRR